MLLSRLRKHVNLLVICSFLILAWLSVILLARTHNLMGAGDLPMHLHQLQEVKLSLSHFQWPFYGVNDFHGSAIMTLYPWINLWPAVLISTFVQNKILVIYLTFALAELVTLLISYFSSLSVSRSHKISYLFAVFYGLSTLYVDYGFSDFDCGEVLTMTFLPLVAFGSLLLLRDRRWLMLSLGMSLIISSHVLNTLIVAFFLLIILVLNARHWTWRKFVNLMKAVILTLITTMIIWLPAIIVMVKNRPITTPPADPLYGTPFRDVVTSSYNGLVSYGISFFALIGLGLGLLCFLKLNRILKQWCLISLVVTGMCSAWFPWDKLPKFLMHLQFTWRLSFIPELFLSYIAAEVLGRYLKSSYLGYLGMIGFIIITVLLQFNGQRQIIAVNGSSQPFNARYLKRKTIRYGRYRITKFDIHKTKNIKIPPAYRINDNQSYDLLLNGSRFMNTKSYYWRQATKPHFSDVNNNIVRGLRRTATLRRTGYNTFTFHPKREMETAVLPILKYRGEDLRLDEDHQPLSYGTDQGLIRLNHVKPGQHTLRVNTTQTSKAYVVSYFSLIIGLIIYLFNLVKIIKRSLERSASI